MSKTFHRSKHSEEDLTEQELKRLIKQKQRGAKKKTRQQELEDLLDDDVSPFI